LNILVSGGTQAEAIIAVQKKVAQLLGTPLEADDGDETL
jgi:hypothetical protein